MYQKGTCLHEFCSACWSSTKQTISNLIQHSREHSALMIQTFPNHTQHPQPYVLTKLYAVRIHKKKTALFLRKYA